MRREVLSEKKGSPFHSNHTWKGRVHCVSNPEYTKGTTWKSMNGYFSTAGLPKEWAKRGDVVKYEISIKNGKTTKVYPFTIKLGGMHEVE